MGVLGFNVLKVEELDVCEWDAWVNEYFGWEVFGGSIRLEMEGDALARFALFNGDDCGGLKGLAGCLGSTVDDRMGS